MSAPSTSKAPRLTARALIDTLCTPDTFTSWDEPLAPPPGAGSHYLTQLEDAQASCGVDEAVVTGQALLDGRPVALVVSEFGFLGGSIGLRASERIIAAVTRATRERLPLIAAPSSGGTRMQEGTPAFLQMIEISKVVMAHKRAGLPYLVHLRHPTTGGVMASWASMGHYTTADPGAMLGFLGPRVFEALYGRRFPRGVQVAENLHLQGIIDDVQPLPRAARQFAAVLRTVQARDHHAPVDLPEGTTHDAADLPVGDVWESVVASRRETRPGLRDLLLCADDVVNLNGTGQGEHDPVLMLSIARFGEQPCVVLGECRQMHAEQRQMGPEGLRVARRGIRLAADLRLPLVTVIDTMGAALSVEAENGGLAGEISRCLGDLAAVPTPTVAVMLGQGTGGAALALLPCDRVVAAQHAWLSPLPPEGASAIIHRDIDHAPDMARSQQISCREMVQAGEVDTVVLEFPDAADEPDAFCERLSRTIQAELASLRARDLADVLRARGVLD